MTTLSDYIGFRNAAINRDFTPGSRATLQPDNQPFSRDGRLANMGMRNMQQAQQRLEATNIPGQSVPAAPMASGADSTMMGFMPPDYARMPLPSGDMSQMYAGYRLPPAPQASYADMYAGYRLPPTPQASYADMYAGYRLPPAPATAAAPQAAPPPLPPVRPYGLGTPEPSVRQSFMDAILRGPAYQSNAMPVITTTAGPMQSGPPIPQSVNWGNPESAADFFRADQAARQLGLLG